MNDTTAALPRRWAQPCRHYFHFDPETTDRVRRANRRALVRARIAQLKAKVRRLGFERDQALRRELGIRYRDGGVVVGDLPLASRCRGFGLDAADLAQAYGGFARAAAAAGSPQPAPLPSWFEPGHWSYQAALGFVALVFVALLVVLSLLLLDPLAFAAMGV